MSGWSSMSRRATSRRCASPARSPARSRSTPSATASRARRCRRCCRCLKKRGEKPIKSATLFTTLTDFSDQGEFTVFLQDDFVDAIERQVEAEGLLDSYYMSKTFSFLRAKDLVYGPAVRSYMMGEAPPAFDLLYWNGDSTNLPGRMAVQYLRGLCQGNQLSEGTLELFGETLSWRTWRCRSMPSPARPTTSRPGRTAFAGW
jgi:poly(3-hydroxyalkanoate) synthetase